MPGFFTISKVVAVPKSIIKQFDLNKLKAPIELAILSDPSCL